MSFILDALKKSERERELQAQGIQPGFVYRRPHTPPAWMMVVVGLLLVNMALIVVMWMRSNNQAAGPLITVNNAAPVTAPPPAAPAKESTSIEARPSQIENTSLVDATDETAKVLANAPVPDGPHLVRQITPEDATKPGANPITTYPKNVSSDVPTLDSIGGAAALNLPQLHLDIHVYSLKDSERFVFINMKKYSEGQTLKEGPLVQRITPDGAVLQYQNQEFLLPRQ
jgi:general secretion pathway protein B